MTLTDLLGLPITLVVVVGGILAIALGAIKLYQTLKNGKNGTYGFKEASGLVDKVIAEVAKTRHDAREAVSEGIAQSSLNHRDILAKLEAIHRDVLAK